LRPAPASRRSSTPTSTKKVELAHTRCDREHDILEVAGRIFFERGYGSTSIGEIASEVGLLKGSLYHYISSKEELLFRVIYEAHETSLHATRVKLVGLAALDAVRAYIYESTLFVAHHPQQSAVFFSEWRHLTGDHLAKIVTLRDENEQLLRTLIHKGQQDGTIRSDIEARLIGYHLIAPVTALAHWYKPNGPLPAEEIARINADLAIASISS
jgi:AcrR family transcriptional regulator